MYVHRSDALCRNVPLSLETPAESAEKTLKRFPHTQRQDRRPQQKAINIYATNTYRSYIYIYLSLLHIYFCLRIQINFFPKNKKNHIQNFYSFGFNTFLFFTPFCVLSGNLSEGGGAEIGVCGCLLCCGGIDICWA